MKKIGLSLICAVLLVAICCTSVFTANLPFADVSEGSWYYDAVSYCYEKGYMDGMDAKNFGTKSNLTRAQLVTILSSIDSIDESAYTNQTFNDVKPGKWYFAPVEWAFANGIVTGYGEGVFAPSDNITREQLAVMLYAFADYKGFEVTDREDLTVFTGDVNKVHSWAYEAVSWAVASGIISGNSATTLNPRGNATRAEAATMIYKFSVNFFGSGKLASDFTVSRAFGDHMTVQRDEKLTVWGFANKAENGNHVEVTFKGEKATGIISNGKWKAVFDKTFEASAEPAEIQVKSATKTVTIKDVLVGDVYYVIGQSNVYWPMQDLINELAAKGLSYQISDVTYTDETNIRLFRNSSTFNMNATGDDRQGTSKVFEDVYSDQAVWQKPSEGALTFSAVGYLYAFNLAKQTDVPIAMIEIDASGLPLTAFAPNELAEKWGSDILGDDGIHYMKLGNAEDNTLSVYPLQSRFVYNQQIYPLRHFSTAGILWYQGESDMANTIANYGKDAWTFSTEFVDLMNYYRDNFGNDDFPVYIMELPACYNFAADAAYLPTGTVRSELGTIPMYLEDSYVIPCSDLWNDRTYSNNIHPYCKPAQAQRAADMVLSNEYGIGGDFNYVAGPVLESVEYTDEYTAVLTFKYVGDGLVAYSEDESGDIYGIQVLVDDASYYDGNWKYFIAVSDRERVSGTATITSENQITVTCEQPIYGVRYNAITGAYFPIEVNLHNSDEIPMVAFVDYK